MTYESLQKLQEAEDEKGGMAEGGETYSNDGCHVAILDSINWPILTTVYQSPPPYVL